MPGASPNISNIDLNAPHSPINANGLHHLNYANCPAVQAFVLADLLNTPAAW
jgi:hypothetical protein